MTIIVLNGCTSAGKSSLARALQEQLKEVFPGLWLLSGIDAAIAMAPAHLHHHRDGFYFDEDDAGLVRLNFGPHAEALLAAHRRAASALAQDGVHLILDEVMATPSMARQWQTALSGLDVIWIGVFCDLDELERRELARGDRRPGQARGQFEKVHAGMVYDIEVDSTAFSTSELCAVVCEKLASRGGDQSLPH